MKMENKIKQNVNEKYEIELFFKGLSGNIRKIGKYIVTQKTLYNLETYLREDIDIDIIDNTDKNPICWHKLKTYIHTKYKELLTGKN